MQSIDVYIDGSFHYGSRDGGSGVWWGHNDPRNISLKCPGNISNSNGAELYAVVGFLEQIGATQSCDQVPPGVTHFNINTDSFFVIISLDICRPAWKKYGWRNQTTRSIIYEGMIRYIDSLVENARLQRDVHISFTYVPAHRGITGNCGADYLAGRASRDDSWPRLRIWQKLEYEVRGFMATTMLLRGVPLSSPNLIEVGKYMIRAWEEGIHRHGSRIMGHEDPYRLAARPTMSYSTTTSSSRCEPTPLAIPYSNHTTTITNAPDYSSHTSNHESRTCLATSHAISDFLIEQPGKNINEEPNVAQPQASQSDARMPTPPATPPMNRKRGRSPSPIPPEVDFDLELDLQEEAAVASYLCEQLDHEGEDGGRTSYALLPLEASVHSASYYSSVRQVPYRKQRKSLSALCESLIPGFVNTRAFWPQTPPKLAILWLKRLLKILPEQEAMPAPKKRKTNQTQDAVVVAQPFRDHLISNFMAVITRLELQLSPSPAGGCPPPLRFIFVCRHDIAPTALSLLDYIPHLTARVNATGGNIRLITLPKGSRKKLRRVLNITPPKQDQDCWRVLSEYLIAIEENNNTDMSLLTSIPDSSS